MWIMFHAVSQNQHFMFNSCEQSKNISESNELFQPCWKEKKYLFLQFIRSLPVSKLQNISKTLNTTGLCKTIYWYELKNRIPKAGLELLQLGWQSLNVQNMTMSYRFCHQGLRLSHVDLVVWNSCTCVILSDNAFNLNFHHTKIDIHICHPQVSLLLCKFNDLELWYQNYFINTLQI